MDLTKSKGRKLKGKQVARRCRVWVLHGFVCLLRQDTLPHNFLLSIRNNSLCIVKSAEAY